MSFPEDSVYFMKKTNELAKQAIDKGELPIAAMVVFNDEIISSSYAKERTDGRRLVHADLLALELADKLKPLPGKRNEMSLFVNLEPCLMCLGAAMVFGIGNIYFSIESPIDGATRYLSVYTKQLGDTPGYNIPNIFHGLEGTQTLALFKEYSAQDSNNGYHQWVRRLIDSLDKNYA